ncbi:MarR family winged helix-turn-helix transcriptional regulator [Amnibacterium kyonggiense]|uniref:MarR family winged helix-turn-helix transcriptional regulator n=1 Tax=Amnibacterium kyonggiense TaxID=595671 RepID=UPI0013C32D8C|nr:MarR family transcriptional regulator [Amnibacterium kyonggiense]
MTSADRSELAERLAFVVGGVNRRLRPPADSLTHIALSALATIDRRGAVRPGELARIEGVAAPGMTRLVADLESRGLVAREADPDDGRSHLVRLTEAGVAAVAAGRRDRAEGVAALLAEIAPEDLRTLEQAVTALESALLRTTPDPARAR